MNSQHVKVVCCICSILLLSPYSSYSMSVGPKLKKMLNINDVSMNLQDLYDSAELIREPSLFISSKPASETVKSGSTVTLRCEITAIPVATVHWLKNGERVTQSWLEDAPNMVEKLSNFGKRTYEEGGTVSVLKLPCLKPEDSGVYTCVADNGHSKATADADIVVEDDFSLETLQQSACVEKKSGTAPAAIFMWTDIRVEREGVNVQLFCRARGSPAPKITWRDPEDKPIEEDNELYQVLPTGDLLIKNADFNSNGGVHKCIASNEYGQDEQESFLYPTKYDGEDEIGSRKA